MDRFGTLNPNGACCEDPGQQHALTYAASWRGSFGTDDAHGLLVSHCALLAEPDRALRDLMHRTLGAAGYEVFESSNLLQVEVGLRVSAVFGAENVLFVIGARLATQCALSISASARERARVRLPQAQVILTYEFGTLAAMPHTELAPCVIRGILEKPFDLHDLHAIAVECRHLSSASGTNGASA